MACNSCNKTFSLLRKEKGCPACGFSYCSNCLKYKLFVPKINAEAKVCAKCEHTAESNEKMNIEPPDAYYKRIGAMHSGTGSSNTTFNLESGGSQDQEILDRLKKLKENTKKPEITTNEDIANRLQKIKCDTPTTTDSELQSRLANLRGVPVSTLQSKPVLLVADSRTEQEEVDELMKQYMEQVQIEGVYEDNFQGVLSDIQTRLHKLKCPGTSTGSSVTKVPDVNDEVEDEKAILKKIIDKVKAESTLEFENTDPELQELPFCEICNEDAKMRCLGCKYLFCKRCFMEHKDDDDGCDKYELYKPPRKDN